MCTELVLPSFRPIQKINPDMQWGDFHLQEDSAHAGRAKKTSLCRNGNFCRHRLHALFLSSLSITRSALDPRLRIKNVISVRDWRLSDDPTSARETHKTRCTRMRGVAC